MSEPLRALTAAGARAVRQAWASGAEATLTAAHTAELGATWEPEALREALSEETTDAASRSALDGLVAPPLHQALPIPRVVAQDRRVWHWLAVAPLRDLMQRRWPAGAERVARSFGDVTDHGLGRLWWAAELTVSPTGTYLDTRRLVRNPRLLDRVLRSGVGRTRPVMLGLLDVLHGESDADRIDRAIRTLGTRAGTVCLEALDRPEVADLVRQILDA